MIGVTAAGLLELVQARHGHFRLESGHHAALWLDLDALFAAPRRTAPFVEALAAAVRSYDVTAVCGPLLGGAFLAQLVAQALDIDFCFTEPIAPTNATGLYRARYRLPRAFHARVRGGRVAIVDDAMSAGSALLGTHAEVESHGEITVAAGVLLMLGPTGADLFARRGLAVEAVCRHDYELWTPDECPLCARNVPLDEKP